MKNPFRWFRSRDKPTMDVLSPAPTVLFGASDAGKRVDALSAMRVSAVYACVRVLSGAIASVPFGVYEELDDGSARAAWKHPLYRVLHDEPNPEMTSFTWREVMMTHLLLWGNSYNQVVRNGYGEVLGLYPLYPEQMEVDRDSDTNALKYIYTDDRGLRHELRPKRDVLHIPALGFDGLKGYSPIATVRNAIGLAIAAEQTGATTFKNGAVPRGILTTAGAVSDKEAVRAAWNSAYGGSANSGKVAILEKGMEFKTVSMSLADAQYIEARKFQISEIARIFNVPLHMIQELDRATFSNIEHQGIEFVKYSLLPWAKAIEQAIYAALMDGESRYYARLNLDGLERGDYKTRMEGYAVGIQNGFMTVNDVRRLENLPLIPAEDGGDTTFMNGNMISTRTAMTNGKNDGKENLNG